MTPSLRACGLALASGCAATLFVWLSACGARFSSERDEQAADADVARDGGIGIDGAVDRACSTATLPVDPLNCGACGHDCRGAACSRGICAAEVVATHPGAIVTLTVDSDQFYFATTIADAGGDGAALNSVSTCPTTGCVGAATVIVSGQSQPTTVRLDGPAIYWIDEAPDKTRVFSCIRNGCVAPVTIFESDPDIPVKDIAIDDSHAVDILADDENGTATLLFRCAPGGCPPGAAPFAVGESCASTNMAYDQGSLYWSNGDVADDCHNGGVYTCPVAGCPMPKLLTMLIVGGRVAGAPSGIYFSNFDGISELVFPSLIPTPITPLPSAPVDLAADGTGVYWIESGGFVRQVPTTGGTPLTLADQQARPHAIALDKDYVYWASSNSEGPGDVILRAAKLE